MLHCLRVKVGDAEVLVPQEISSELDVQNELVDLAVAADELMTLCLQRWLGDHGLPGEDRASARAGARCLSELSVFALAASTPRHDAWCLSQLSGFALAALAPRLFRAAGASARCLSELSVFALAASRRGCFAWQARRLALCLRSGRFDAAAALRGSGIWCLFKLSGLALNVKNSEPVDEWDTFAGGLPSQIVDDTCWDRYKLPRKVKGPPFHPMDLRGQKQGRWCALCKCPELQSFTLKTRSSEDASFRASELHPEDAKFRRCELQSFQSFTLKTRSSEDGSFRAFGALPRRREVPKTGALRASKLHPEDAELRRRELQSFREFPRRREIPKTRASELSELRPDDAKLQAGSFSASDLCPDDGSFGAFKSPLRKREAPTNGASARQGFTLKTRNSEDASFRASP
eukprot:s3233_g1.t1